MAQLVQQDCFPVVVGGDHALAVGSISGAKRHYPHMKVAWVDAHADVNNETTSQSGNIHGMPVAILAGLSQNLGERFKCLDLQRDL